MSDLIDREDAIKDAESWVGMNWYEQHLIRNVVEWLKEFPPAKHGTNLVEVGTDCISRQAAITQLSHNKNKGDDEWELAVENDIQTIWKLPSAEPKRGYWIKTGDKEETYGPVSKCSVCGVIDYEGNFCPHCGADMRGDKNA